MFNARGRGIGWPCASFCVLELTQRSVTCSLRSCLVCSFGTKGAILVHCASVISGPDRATDPPSTLLTLLVCHVPSLNLRDLKYLSRVVQPLPGSLGTVAY